MFEVAQNNLANIMDESPNESLTEAPECDLKNLKALFPAKIAIYAPKGGLNLGRWMQDIKRDLRFINAAHNGRILKRVLRAANITIDEAQLSDLKCFSEKKFTKTAVEKIVSLAAGVHMNNQSPERACITSRVPGMVVSSVWHW